MLAVLLFNRTLVIEIVLQTVAVLIAPKVQVVDCQEYFAQIEVFLAELFVTMLDLRLDFVFFLYLILYLARQVLDLVIQSQNLLVILFL